MYERNSTVCVCLTQCSGAYSLLVDVIKHIRSISCHVIMYLVLFSGLNHMISCVFNTTHINEVTWVLFCFSLASLKCLRFLNCVRTLRPLDTLITETHFAQI
jgi:hypothetical protein